MDTQNATPFVDFQDVWLAYNEQLLRENHFAVEAIDLKVKKGEFIAIVGPSGCGKSTLLAMIAGLETVTSGEIYIGDRLVNSV
ncbi:MAG: ATP-binding cassette domain-containing protein, partial [Pseudacidovorax sp.]|nr:ATP-binding cassette domain-containing protein [Pseudacidovorax sp.]